MLLNTNKYMNIAIVNQMILKHEKETTTTTTTKTTTKGT
jgi:hypothetical protein